MTTVPENLPTLSAGGHSPNDGQACLMEYVSLIAGEKWSDSPLCTHPVLAAAARMTNDRMIDANRHLLVPLIGRLLDTAETGSEEERKALDVALAIFSAKSVRHLVKSEDSEVIDAAVSAAENWLAKPTKGAVTNAKDAVVTAAYTSGIRAAVYAAIAAVNPPGDFAATYAATEAVAITAGNRSLVGNLTALIDEYDRLTGRTQHREVKSEELDDVNRRLASITASHTSKAGVS